MTLNLFTYSCVHTWKFSGWPVCLDHVWSWHTDKPCRLIIWPLFFEQLLTFPVPYLHREHMAKVFHCLTWYWSQCWSAALWKETHCLSFTLCLFDSFATRILFSPISKIFWFLSVVWLFFQSQVLMYFSVLYTNRKLCIWTNWCWSIYMFWV